jgi:hypothetical protein
VSAASSKRRVRGGGTREEWGGPAWSKATRRKEGGVRTGASGGWQRGPAQHGRGSSGLFRQWRAAHASWARQERASNTGRSCVRDAVWTRLTGGVQEGEGKVGQCGGGAPTCRPGQHSAGQRGLNSV